MFLLSKQLPSLIALAIFVCAGNFARAEEFDLTKSLDLGRVFDLNESFDLSESFDLTKSVERLDGQTLLDSTDVKDEVVDLDSLISDSDTTSLDDLDELLGQMEDNDVSDDDDISLDLLEAGGDDDTDVDTDDDALSLDGLGDGNSAADALAEPDMVGSKWTDNLRKVWDLSVRPEYNADTDGFAVSTFIGLDVHKVFTDREGDWGTLILQPYLTRIDNLSPQLAFFDDPHDFELICRICNFNYTRYGRGKTNFRVGHFEVPFGLEQIVNTNGTLRDYTSLRNFGFKSDWGISLNGETSNIEYEVSLTRGSGDGFRRRGGPYLVAGRVGTQRDNPVVIGASALHGQTYDFFVPGTTRRTRVGVDLTVGIDAFAWMTELSAGVDDDAGVFNALIEWDWHSKSETVLVYNQLLLRGFNPGLNAAAGWDVGTRNFLGVRWQKTSKWSLSGQWEQSLHALQGEPNEMRLALQARYRF